MKEPSPIPILLDAVYHGVNREVARRLAAAGFSDITPAHGKVFEQMEPGASISDLAERAQITKQSMRELVLQLEDRGYLTRTPHPTDRRAQVVELTARGNECVAAAWRALDELVTGWAAALGAGELRTLHELLDRLATCLDEQR